MCINFSFLYYKQRKNKCITLKVQNDTKKYNIYFNNIDKKINLLPKNVFTITKTTTLLSYMYIFWKECKWKLCKNICNVPNINKCVMYHSITHICKAISIKYHMYTFTHNENRKNIFGM